MANTLKFGNENWATKKDSILAYNDENDNFKPLPFVTSRASTATRVNKAGLLETVGVGIPRVDYLGNTKGAYLLEPQSTNLITQSEAFANSYWTKSGASVVGGFSAPSADSPLGAFKLVESATNASHFIYSGLTYAVATGNDYTYSVLAKKGENNFLQVILSSVAFSSTAYANFDLLNGVIGTIGAGVTAKIKSLANGWFKISVTHALLGTGSHNSLISLIDSATSVRNQSRTGDGTSGVYIFGAQIEQSSYATSYIPTSGSAITKLADTASQTLPDGIINSSQGVLYAEISALSNEGDTYRTISLNDGSGTNTNRILIGYSNTDNIYAQINNTVIGITGANFNVKNLNKLAVVYNGSVAKFFLNGAQAGTGITTAPTLIGLDNITSSSGAATSVFEGKVKDMKVYNTSLTDAELVTLTKV